MIKAKQVSVFEYSDILNAFREHFGVHQVNIQWPDGTLQYEQDYFACVGLYSYEDDAKFLNVDNVKERGSFELGTIICFLNLVGKIEATDTCWVTNHWGI